MDILYIIRGLPGSGKTTLAKRLSTHNYIEADIFHKRKGGIYDFDRDNLSKAHNWCKLETERRMRQGISPLVVSNTFITNEEIEPYINLAEQYNYLVQVLAIENKPFESEHEVPPDIIKKMADKWEMFILRKEESLIEEEQEKQENTN